MQRADLVDRAHIALPTCSHAEKDGTFVNLEGIAQPFYQAFRPHGDALPDWQIFMRMARAMGHALSFTFLEQIQEEMFEATAARQQAEAEAEAARAAAEPEATVEADSQADAPAAAKDERDLAEDGDDEPDEGEAEDAEQPSAE